MELCLLFYRSNYKSYLADLWLKGNCMSVVVGIRNEQEKRVSKIEIRDQEMLF